MEFDLNFRTDYHQFYLTDKNAKGDTSSDLFWTDQAFKDKIAIETGFLGLSIGNEEGIVKCKLIILNSKNLSHDWASFDHVVEASLKIESGILQILDCPNSEIQLETKIERGDYRVRFSSMNLSTAYDENPSDSYFIEMWEEIPSVRTVLKGYSTK